MIDAIKDNMYFIVVAIIIFISGIGIGAAINEAINSMKGEKDDESR